MGKVVAFVVLLFLLAEKVASRDLQYDAAELVSDGVSDGEEESFLHLKGMDSSEANCHQMYGFLPCSTNLPGHIFLIVIYEYLLYCGESYVSGDERDLLFGKGYWGAVFFQLLDSLPEPLVLAASVALSNNEAAEEHLVMAVGMLVGSSILLLTVVWGFCIFFGQRKFDGNRNNHGLRLLTGSGVVTDSETRLRAILMLFSLIPFMVILTVRALGASQKDVLALSPWGEVACLLSYFIYQHVDKSIQRRTLEYAEIEKKIEMRVPFYEVQALMLNRNRHLMRLGIEMEKKMETNKHNIDGRDGVPLSFKEWFFQKVQLMNDPYSQTKFNQVAQLLLEEKNSLMELIDAMVQHAFPNNNGETQNESTIDGIFKMIDRDGSSFISPSELKDVIIKSKQGDTTDVEDVVEMLMTHLDVNASGNIDLEEFRNGMTEWFWEIEQHKSQNHITIQDEDDYQRDEAKSRRDGKLKAIGFVGLGIFMLTFFAEPLTHTVQIFSESVDIPPFYISFIFLPLATHARTALAAIGAAKQKRPHTTSSTFSEIYHKVLMNNLMGFALLFIVMYFRGLTWHFSAEVLTLVIVCAVVALFASINSKFPIWTLFIAFPLYPLSLLFFNLVNIYFV